MKKTIMFFSIFVCIFLFFVGSVNADNIADAGDNLVQKGSYDNNRFVAGKKIINKATIDGLSFIAGKVIELEGTSSYDFIAGETIFVKENVLKDIFVAGNKITIDKDAIVGRDAYIAGNDIVIKSNIAGCLRLGGNIVDLRGITISKDAYVLANEIILDKDTIINGKFSYPEDANVKGLKAASIGSVKTIKGSKMVKKNEFKDIIFNFVASIISSFIVMVVVFYILPNVNDKLNNITISSSEVIKTSLLGLLILILVPIISVIALFTKLLSPLALIVIALYVIFIYLSSLVVSYIIGNYIDDKLTNKDNKYLSLMIGIVVVKVVKLIPVIGDLFGAVILFYGLGLIFIYIRKNAVK